jgi:hypothetical protein
MSTHQFKIAVLTPTRGRTKPLEIAIKSLIEKADHPETIEILVAFDDDDVGSIEYFQEYIQPWLDDNNVEYTVLSMARQGYHAINRYYNEMAKNSDSDWLFGWSDDSIMETQGWDTMISQHDGEFKLLKVHTHNEHPYSIFPIFPRAWYNLFGHYTRHGMGDAELSQIAYLLDIVEIIPVWVTHDRADLTGNNLDDTVTNRVSFEGNPKDPRDFHHPTFTQWRVDDTEILAEYMRSHGLNTTWWENVKAQKQDPWEKLRANDINKQMHQYQQSK